MKIGIVCQATAGGSGILATELGLALAERGNEVHFISLEAPFRLRTFAQNVYSHYVDVINYPLFKLPPYSLALASKISLFSLFSTHRPFTRRHQPHIRFPHRGIPLQSFFSSLSSLDKRSPIELKNSSFPA